MTPRLQKYLALERLMLLLDEDGDPGADVLRDLMDPIWYSLTDEERRVLDERAIGRIRVVEAIRITGNQNVFGALPGPGPARVLPHGPIRGWVRVA